METLIALYWISCGAAAFLLPQPRGYRKQVPLLLDLLVAFAFGGVIVPIRVIHKAIK